MYVHMNKSYQLSIVLPISSAAGRKTSINTITEMEEEKFTAPTKKKSRGNTIISANLYEPIRTTGMNETVYTVCTPNSVEKKAPKFRVKLPKITLITWAVGLLLLALVFVLAITALIRTRSRRGPGDWCTEEKIMSKLKLPGNPGQGGNFTEGTDYLPLKKAVRNNKCTFWGGRGGILDMALYSGGIFLRDRLMLNLP